MYKNYLRSALRNLYRYKSYSVINILGLAIGIASVIMIFLIVQEEADFNLYNENAQNIYRVNKLYSMNGQINVNQSTPYPLEAAAREGIAGVINTVHLTFSRSVVTYEDKVVRERVCVATPALFEIFTFNFIEGDPSAAINDVNSIAISKSTAEKYYGNREAVGKILTFDNEDEMLVTAVYEDIPLLSDYRFDVIAHIDIVTDPSEMDDWYSHWMETFILTEDNVDRADVEAEVDALMKKNLGEQSGARLQSLREIHLYSVEGLPTARKFIIIFSSIALLILVIACINFMNLATAQAAKRVKEVGIRKISGANRKVLISQFLGEAFCYSFIALFISIIMVEISLPYFETIIGREIGLSALNFTNIIYLGILLLVVTLASGSYPAFLLSSYTPVKTLKSGFSGGSKGLKLRTVIVVVQFTLAISMLIGTGVIYSQLKYMREKDLGFTKENLIYLRLNNDLYNKFDVFKTEVSNTPEVLNMTRTSSLPDQVWNIMRGLTWEGKSSDEGSAFAFLSADNNILQTLDLELIKGRGFSEDMESDENKVLVNRASLAMLETENPIGMKIGDDGLEIIGVVENFNSLPLQYKIEPLLITIIPDYYNYVLIKISGSDPAAVIEKIETSWLNVCPDFPFEYKFLDDVFQSSYDAEIKAGMLFKVFAGLGIFIACLGLFGLTSFLIENRKREIGIRKVLGSSSEGLVWNLSRHFLIWVGLANCIAFPLAWYFMNRWLQGFVYRTEMDLRIYLLSGAATGLAALLVMSVKIWKAANMNPADVLKCE